MPVQSRRVRGLLPRSSLLVAATLLGIATSSLPPARAANLYWDANGTAAGTGGAGTWDTTSAFWSSAAAGIDATAIGNFTSADIAIFTGSAGTATLTEPIAIGGLVFAGADFTVTGNTLTLAADSGSPTISVTGGNVATLTSVVAGTSGLIKSGNGVLRLTNAANTFTGTATIARGSLVISAASALGADDSAISILTINQVPSSNALEGFGGGQLVLDGSMGGHTFARDINFEGRGPLGDRSAAILSIGDNTVSGTLTSAVSPLAPATFRNSRINSINGTLALSGTVVSLGTTTSTFLSFGGINAAGVANFDLTGTLSGSGSMEKSGSGILYFRPSSVAAFSGTLRISGSATGQQSSVRVTQATVGGLSIFGANAGTGGSSMIDMNGGVLELLSSGDLNFNGLSSGKNVYLRANSTFYTGPAAGGSSINGLATFGTFRMAANTTGTFNSRNGYGVTLQAWTQESSNNNNTITNNMGGTLSFVGGAWGNNDTSARTLTIGGNGNTLITGSVTATAANHIVTKSGSGQLTIEGTASNYLGVTNVNGGAVAITDFRSVNNNSTAFNIGSGGTAGALIIGTSVSPTAAGLTTSKPINLAGSTGGVSIYANQSGSNPVVFNGEFSTTAGGATESKTLSLGGANSADNVINTTLENQTGATTGSLSLSKVGVGTWVLAGANIFTGTTTITEGVLKLKANAATSTVLRSTAAVTFAANNTYAGGTLEFVGQAGVNNVQPLGTLAYSQGANTIKVSPGAGGTASLTFANITTGGGATINVVGADFANNKVTITQRNAGAYSDGLLTRSVYWNGDDFAYAQGGVLRATSYGVDAGTATTVTGSLTSGSEQRVQGVAAITANTSISTLKLDGDGASVGGAFTLTLSGGGVLSTGGNNTLATSTLALGTGAFVVRVNNGVLGVSSNITGSGGLTKSGPGILEFSGTNAQTGTISINEGTVRLTGSGRLGAAADLILRAGTTLDLNGVTPATATNAFNNNGLVTNAAAGAVTFTVGNNNGTGTSFGVISQADGVINVTKLGTGAQNWLGNSSYTGVTTIGSTGLVTVDFLTDIGQNSGIGRGDATTPSTNAGSLVYNGTTGGIVYAGSIRNGDLVLGSRSASTNRLFTLAGTAAGSGATLSSTASNNNAVVWSNTGDIVFGVGAAAQTLRLAGGSTGDNTFNPRLTDNGPNVTALTKVDAGQWNLGNANNAYTGLTSVANGVLAVNTAGALPANSPVVLGSTTTSGVLQLSGVFARNLTASPAAGVGTVTWGGTTGGGGFAAHTTPLTVTLNGGAGIVWGSGGFVGTGGTQALVFGSASALADVTFTNSIDLGASARTITVNDNGNTGAEFATMTGVMSGSGGVFKNGSGILRLWGLSSYAGTTMVNAGTLVVSSLGGSTGDATSSVGAGNVTMDNSNAVAVGNASTSNAVLQYVGAGEVSDRKIRINATTGDSAGAQIHADGTGPLILTNVANDMVNDASHKNLWLRGASPYVNEIRSQLSDNGGQLRVNIDGGTAWVLTNPGNNYTGATTVSGGALGIGSNTAIPAALNISGGNVFAHGADRTLAVAVTLGNNSTFGFIGDHSLTFSDARLGASANNLTLNNGITAGKSLTFNGLVANALTDNRAWVIDGPGQTVINGVFTTSTTRWLRVDKVGDGTLVLGTSGTLSNWNVQNSSSTAIDLDRGTLRFAANEAIPSVAGSGGLLISPELAAFDMATVDFNGTTQTITSLTATTNGTLRLDNTSSSPAAFRFGTGNAAINFGSGLGSYSVLNTGAGALSLVKLGNSNVTFNSGITLANKGEIAAEGGSFTITGQATAASGLRAIGSSTLALTGGITNPGLMRAVEVGAGSTLTLLDGTGSAFAGLTALRLGNTGTGTATLNLNVGTDATDTFTLNAGGTLALGGTVTFNLTDAGLDENTTYTLLNLADGGISAFGLGSMLQGAMPGGFDALTWSVTDNQVALTTGNLITGALYWRGLTSTAWNGAANNWSTDKAGAVASTTFPGAGTDVIFSHNGATGVLTTTLEQNYRLNSLTFESGTTTPTSVTITPGANTTSRLEVSDHITLLAGAPASVTLATNYKIGAAQTWTVTDAATTLTFSGALLGAADVTKAGLGKVVLSAVADPTFNAAKTFDLTIGTGNFEVQNVGSLGTVVNDNLANIIVNGGGFYYANATGGTVPNPITLAGGSLSGAGTNHTYSGPVVVTSASTVNLADSNGPATNAARNITLSGALTGAGSLTVESSSSASSGNQLGGTLTLNNAASSWTGALIVNRGTVTVASASSPSWTGNDVTFSAFGRLIFQGVNAQTLTRTGALALSASAIAEFQIDNVSGTLASDFTVDQTSPLSLGNAAALRIFLADSASKLSLSGGVVLGGNASISSSGDAAGFVTISGVISESSASAGLTLHDDAGGWGQTNRLVRLAGANTFSGGLTLADGILEFSTVSNVGGGASNLGQGSGITLSGGNLRFTGNTSQTTNRPLTFTAGATLSAAGTDGAVITFAGPIDVTTRTADGSAFTLGGIAGSAGVISSAILTAGDAADFTINGGSWTMRTATSRIGDDVTVTGAGTVFSLESGLFQVRDDFNVTTDAVLNLGATGALSFSTATLSADASLRVMSGAAVTFGANNSVVVTDFDGLRVGTDGTGVGYLHTAGFAQSVAEFILGNRNNDRSGVVTGTGVITVTSNLDLYKGTFAAGFAGTGALTLDKLSMNTVTLSGSGAGLTGTGATSVYEGTLILDYAADTSSKIIAGGALDMRGGTLSLAGNASSSASQTVASFTLGNGGSNVISFSPAAGNGLVLNLNAITRAINAQDGTLRIVLPAGEQSLTNGVTTDTTNGIGAGSAAILGGWLTVSDGTGVYFARNATNAADGNIVAAMTAAKDATSAWLAGENVSDATGFTGPIAYAAPNSLRFNAAAGSDLVLSSAGVVGVGSGGVLVTANVGGTPSIVGGTLFSGARASEVPELIFIQDSAQVFEVSAAILANHALTKSGNGVLLLSGQNRYSGVTEVQNGVLRVSGGNAVGDASLVNLSASRASTFQLLANETIGRLSGGSRQTDQDLGVVAVGSNTLTINHYSSTAATFDGIFTGNGTIIRNGTSGIGNFMLRGITGANFTGSLVLNGGLTYLEVSGTMDASSITINRGASFLISNNGTTRSSARLPDAMSMTLNSADGAWNGETRPSGLVIRTDQNATTNETIGVLSFASGASYFRGDASGNTGVAGLITSNFVRTNGATITARGRNLGAASGNRNFLRIVSAAAEESAFAATLVGGGGAAGTKNISVLPWAIGQTQDANITDDIMGNSLVTYVVATGSGAGLRPLDLATEYQTFATKTASTENIRVSLAADLAGLSGQTINALVVNNANTTAGIVAVTGTGATQTLAVTAGTMLFTATGAITGTPAMGITLGGFDGGITVGGTNEYVAFVQNPTSAVVGGTVTATISSPLASAADITKSGRGVLVLSAVNAAGGGARRTTVNEGVLQIGDLDNIGGVTGSFVFAGGTLRLGAGFTDDVSQRTISFLQGGGTIDTNGVDLTLAGSLGSGVGSFTKSGLGNLTLNAVATYGGGTTVGAGTLTIGANDAIGVGGPLAISGGATLALGSSSITISALTTSGASPAITGTGTITASQGFSFAHTGDITVAAVLAGSLGLSKSQSSVLTLTGMNTYAGTTEVTAGTLVIDSITNVGGGASSLGAPTSAENGIIRLGLTTNGAGLRYVGTGHSTDRIIGLQGTTGTITITASGTGALVLNGGARFEMGGNKTLTLRGDAAPEIVNSIGRLTEAGGSLILAKADTGTWSLSAAAAYTGQTQVDAGILRVAGENFLPAETAVRMGTGATAGVLDLGTFSQTVTSLLAQTNSPTATNQVLIGTGRTLTVTGAVTLGANVAAGATTLLTLSGGGSFENNNDGGTFQVGGATGGTNTSATTADFSGLASFSVNLGATGVFRVGDANSNSSGSPASSSTLKLSGTAASIVAGSLHLGQGTNQGSAVQTLSLGGGTNIIRADLINIGGNSTRSGGALVFTGAAGSVQIRGVDGTSPVANLNMVNGAMNTGIANATSFLLAGHSADVLIGSMTMAAKSAGSGATTAIVTFDQGSFEVASLAMTAATGAYSGTISSTATFGGGTLVISSLGMGVNSSSAAATVSASLTVSGGVVTLGSGTGAAVNMGNAASGRTASSSLTITGGAVSLSGNILRTGGAGTENATVTLSGGVLDLNGFFMGESARPIVFNAQAGTLRDVGTLNGGGGLTKTGAGTLTLEGSSAYTGATSVSAGSLIAQAGALAATSALTVSGGSLTAADFAGTPAITVGAAGTAVISGTGLTAGAVTVDNTADDALHFSGATGTVTLTSLGGAGKARFSSNVTVGTITGGTTTVGGVAAVTTLTAGTLNLNGATASIGTLNGGTVNLGTTALTVNDGTFGGLLAGANGSLIKATSGALTISGANTFGGGTTINEGTLTISNVSALGTGRITVAAGAFLDLANLGVANAISAASPDSILNGPTTSSVTTTGSTSVTTVLTGTGGLAKTDGGELTLTTPNFFTGAVTANTAGAVISAAYLADNSSSLGASALNDPTKLVLGAGATLEFTGTTATTTSRSFTVAGAAALAVDAAAAPLTFSSSSIMALDPADPTPELKLVANNAGVNRFEAQLSADDIANNRGLSNLAIDGTGKWVLGGSANRFKGDVRVAVGGGGTLGFESGSLGAGATYASSVIEVANGSTLAWSGSGNSDDISSRLSVPAGATAKLDLGGNDVTFATAPTMGSGASLQKEGSGKLNIAAAVNAPTLNVAVSSGMLSVNGTLGNVTLGSGATLGGSGTLGAVTTAAGSTIAPGNSPGVMTTSSMALVGNTTFLWEVQDAQAGPGVGGYDKTVISGSLDLTGASAINKITLKINSLTADGVTIGNALNFGPPNGASSIRTFEFASVQTGASGVLLNNGENISDVFQFDLSQFTYTDGSASNAGLWSIDWNQGTGAITLTAVPEPSTYGFGLGALALAAAAIRRRKRQAKA